MTQAQSIFSELGWSGLSGTSGAVGTTAINQTTLNAITNNSGTLDYTDLLNKTWQDASAGVINIPSNCDFLVSGALAICDPGRTGSAGAVLIQSDTNPFSNYIRSDNFAIMQWFAGVNASLHHYHFGP